MTYDQGFKLPVAEVGSWPKITVASHRRYYSNRNPLNFMRLLPVLELLRNSIHRQTIKI